MSAIPIHSELPFARSSIDYGRLIQTDRVHASMYSDPAVFRDELATLYGTSWVYVGHDSEVPAPGDFCRKMVGLQSVIMARHTDGTVHVMYNRCPHRASLVCHQDHGHGTRLTCRYHGWSFNMRGDLLTVPGPEGYDDSLDKSALGLTPLPRVAAYRGFVFASLAAHGPSLDEHLGLAKGAIDQICNLAPQGEIELSAGWMKTRIRANWKMIVENQVDGYHAPFVHGSLMNANRRFATVRDRKESSPALVRDLGSGHSEIDHSTDYRDKNTTLRWSGGIEESRLPGYVSAMNAAYGPQEARRRMVDGPPHTAIFPNLFLAEMAIMVVQPLSEKETIHWTTPVMLKGGGDLNERSLRRGEGAVGPAGFIIADDTEISEVAQLAAANLHPEWLLLKRGLHTEELHSDGTRTAGLMDETTQRAFWREYKKVMEAAQ
jgi:phenylpropionate dioxygenase-like ring-hydroxylating dioxygenase large terminal subunit